MKNQITVHPCIIAKALEEQVGIKKLTAMFNYYRSLHRANPVKVHTVKRYNNAGSGYEQSLPRMYKNFLISRVS